MTVKENLLSFKKRLPGHITLVAVSKTKPVELIREAYETGHRDFGENYVQELEEKHKILPDDIRWHFIGHLQTNKVRYIAPFVHLIHGVDSLKLLQEINKQAIKNNRVINCLLQIHIAREETKFGLSFDECDQLLSSEQFGMLKNIAVRGFMGMASNTDNEEIVRKEFLGLKTYVERKGSERISPQFDPGILSCGMSGDYLTAIECGSTMIRIGSMLFGERNYVK